MEDRFRVNFFELVSSFDTIPTISSKEWFLTTFCVDELNYRLPQTSFLCGAGLFFWCGKRSFVPSLRNWCRSMYFGLVCYDVCLQQRNRFPATTFWMSASTLESDMGRATRRIYTPRYHLFENFPGVESVPLLKFIVRSILLQSWLQCIFEGSHFPQSIRGTERKLSRIRISSNFLQWNILRCVSDNSDMKLVVNIFPSIQANEALLLSYKNRDVFLPHMSIFSTWWYKLNFTIVDFLKQLEVIDIGA